MPGMRRGFTLIEVLVVIAIMAVLVALLLPAAQRARESARATQCRNNLKQIGIALHNYHDLYRSFPPGWVGATPGIGHDIYGMNGFGWGTFLLPALDQANLYGQFDFSKAINDFSTSPVNNQSLLRYKLTVFLCPSDPVDDDWTVLHSTTGHNLAQVASANYIGMYGIHDFFCGPGIQCRDTGPLFQNSAVRFSDISDGTSNSVIVGERRSDATNAWFGNDVRTTWSGVVPDGVDMLEIYMGEIDEGPGGQLDAEDFASFHGDCAHMLFCDGHVKLIQANTDFNTLQALATYQGADTLGDY